MDKFDVEFHFANNFISALGCTDEQVGIFNQHIARNHIFPVRSGTIEYTVNPQMLAFMKVTPKVLNPWEAPQ